MKFTAKSLKKCKHTVKGNNMNYNLEMKKIINNMNTNEKPKLLLHSCCSVCSAHVLSVLVPFFSVSVYYFNQNIHPFEEYERRRESQKLFLQAAYGDEVEMISPRYDSAMFYAATRGYNEEKEGGARCALCFNLRLTETAMAAKKADFQYFTTTLTVSPHKNAPLINTIGQKIANQQGVLFLPADFKKENGYKHSNELAKEYNLYRQDYCGCEFSIV